MTNKAYYEFNSIFFRKLEKSDLDLLINLKIDSWFNTHKISVLNAEDQQRWFDSLDKEVHFPKNLILVAYQSCTEVIGLYKIFDIDWVSRTANVAWDVFKQHRNRGLGKKIVFAGSKFCFNVFNLNRLNCEILSHNEASIKCAENSYFVKEGTKRECVIKKGIYYDSLIYGCLHKDFIDQI